MEVPLFIFTCRLPLRSQDRNKRTRKRGVPPRRALEIKDWDNPKFRKGLL